MPPSSPAEIDPAHLGRWLVELCRDDTTSGQEDAGLERLLALLGSLGAEVTEQQVEPGRTNVLASWGQPRVLFSTHLDTVPPYLPPVEKGDAIWGRGACDAKGQAVAQLGAIQRLLDEGRDGLAWLGVVGEETDSAGARAALQLAPKLAACRALVNGEPTGARLASGQRGTLHLRLTCQGKPAHSGTPERGVNALWLLIEWLEQIRDLPGVHDPQLGDESWNLSSLRGGTAPNIVPDRAEAEILGRTVPDSTLLASVEELAPPTGRVAVLLQEPPVVFPAVAGFEQVPVPFGSDAGTLSALVESGTVVLTGAGRIEIAHTDEEHLRFDELMAGVELNVRLARHFLELTDDPS